MTRNQRVFVAGALALAAGIAIAATTYAVSATGPSRVGQHVPTGAISLRRAAAANFPLYYPGPTAAGIPLHVILRGYNSGPIEDVDFLYGDCYVTEGNEGCASPIEVQVWPACTRNLSLYKSSGPPATVPVVTRVRGVPGAFFENFHRLEFQTGISTVVIFASGYDELMQVASDLRGLNVNVGPHVRLPAPAAGAVEGNLTCESLSGAVKHR